MTLEQPFEAHSHIVSKELLQPTLALSKGGGYRSHGAQRFVALDGRDDVIEAVDVRVGLRLLSSQQIDERVDCSRIIEGRHASEIAPIGIGKHCAQVDDSFSQISQIS